MNPTLREPELMEIMPYEDRPLRIGDVVFFIPPEFDQPVVHRIVRITPEGIATRGDNNTSEDSILLQAKHIQGRVVAAWRGQKKRKIAGGFQGRLTSRWFRWRRIIDHGVSPVLHPLYQALCKWSLIARLLPAQFRPRVVVFRVQRRDQFQLLLGDRAIGRYDDHKQQWQIQRPFHLLVDGRALPRRQDRERFNRQALTERRRGMGPLLKKGVRHELVLADGTRWIIVGGDKQAAAIAAQLGCVMKLGKTGSIIEPANNGNLCQLIVQVDTHSSVADCYVPLAPGNDGVVVCIINPKDNQDSPHLNLVRLSLVIAREAQTHGGVLIHGALAELEGSGVILAAPGGTGKTTASNRLPLPWRSLCDDTTLVVRDLQGNYWAHPWPTWSRFLDGGPGGSWDVQRAVPLKGIFILDRAIEDRVEPVGPGHAVSMLVECVRQASMFMAPGLFKEEINALHLERFNNLCALAGIIPAYVLHLNRTDAFWEKIDEVLARNHE